MIRVILRVPFTEYWNLGIDRYPIISKEQRHPIPVSTEQHILIATTTTTTTTTTTYIPNPDPIEVEKYENHASSKHTDTTTSSTTTTLTTTTRMYEECLPVVALPRQPCSTLPFSGNGILPE
jgi:hypothetical protein